MLMKSIFLQYITSTDVSLKHPWVLRNFSKVRIAYVLNKESLEVAIDILAEALKVYPGRTI